MATTYFNRGQFLAEGRVNREYLIAPAVNLQYILRGVRQRKQEEPVLSELGLLILSLLTKTTKKQ